MPDLGTGSSETEKDRARKEMALKVYNEMYQAEAKKKSPSLNNENLLLIDSYEKQI